MEAKDEMYCFEIARRSVSRAAVHLGIDNMTEAALDVMADILLTYLSRTGKAMAHLVEASGRTSAHANILDAFQACQVLASPAAVGRLHLRDPDEHAGGQLYAAVTGQGLGGSVLASHHASSSSPSNLPPSEAAGWKGLAAFVFGPKWLDDKEDVDDDDAILGGGRQPGGGKVGPATLTTLEGDETGGPTETMGWEAPYLEEVPAFPRASDRCANPHALPKRVGLSLHRKVEVDTEEVVEEEEMVETLLASIPDDTFTDGVDIPLASVWGGMKKRKHNNTAGDEEGSDRGKGATSLLSSPPSKRVKLNDGSIVAKKKGAETSITIDESVEGGGTFPARADPPVDGLSNILPYVPSFYPAPPPTKSPPEQGRVVVDLQGAEKRLEELHKKYLQQPLHPSVNSVLMDEDAGSKEVRSSLVQLSQYWGSGWDDSAPAPKGSGATVPMGRTEAVSSGPADDPIKPMSKPSGSRVSRILEGSMDAAAMQ
jgi:hypothetical protein